jgi:uncharacterized membrane protein YbaN (DUF454 family)
VKRQVERVVRIVGGSVLLLIGFIGGFIPVLQGWIFVIAGLTLLAPESKRARRALDWAKAKVKRGGESDSAQKKEEKEETDE